MSLVSDTLPSPFHAGEIKAQIQAGKRDAMAAIGPRVIRTWMPGQHREFFEMIPFIFAGSVDAEGWPWASVLTGGPGFISTPDAQKLHIAAAPVPGDPLEDALRAGADVGLLGIELATRRRNRLNARVAARDAEGFSLDVVQSFGNCPQYIQTRDIRYVRDASEPGGAPAEQLDALDDDARAFISTTDMLIVASFATTPDNAFASGADVSHRGGQVGFLKAEGNTITVPDFAGNNFFNTIGNFLVNPRAGLLFPDFATGDLLMLTGTVELLDDTHPDVMSFQGAERAWRFTLDHGLRLRDALPMRADFGDWSPNSLMADTWEKAAARQQAETQRNAWRNLLVTAVKDESSVIRSVTFEAADGAPLLPFEAGQFLTLRVPSGDGMHRTRTYTVSSPPGDACYRISVKREGATGVSGWLHDHLKPGDLVEARAPRGSFHLDAHVKRPAVLLAGGVGVTPMVAMTGHVLNEAVRKRYLRPLTIIHAASSTQERAFAGTFRAAEDASHGKIRYISVISRPEPRDIAGETFDVEGRVTPDLIRQALAYDDYDFYLCGPPGFMQSTYDILRDLGAPDARIFAESFGPAALARRQDDAEPDQGAEAESVLVTFRSSGVEQQWKSGGATLLETAEAQGLSPEFSCRSGSCGSCLTRKTAGNVVYRSKPSAEHNETEVLICCAVPAAGTENLILEL